MIALHSGNLLGQSNPSTGGGNEGFNNTIENLTISLGTGNAGAQAINWVAHNIAAIRNVSIKTVGAAAGGIVMTRNGIGPALISNVDISGPFAVGFDVATPEYCLTAEHVTIAGATEFGIRNSQNTCCFRDVTVTTTSGVGVANIDPIGTAINKPWGQNEGLIVWQDGVITGNGRAALDAPNGSRNFSNVNVVNFNGSTNQSLDGVFQQAIQIGSPDWQLTVKNTPIPPMTPSSQWKKIVAPLAPTDATSAIQTALSDPTAKVVYLPTGTYKVTRPIVVADNIERIEFLFSILQLGGAKGYDLFRTNVTRTKDLFMRRLLVENSPGGINSIVNSYAPSPSRLIITDCSGPNLFTRQSTAGEVYGENCNNTHIVIDGGSAGVWLRQFDAEVTSTKVFNVNAPLWILGLKTEQASTAVSNDGGNVEIVGGYHWPGAAVGVPMLTNINDGRISAAYTEDELSSGFGWTVEETSTINGVTNTVPVTAFPQRGPFNGRVVAKLSTDDFIPKIKFIPLTISPSATVGSSVATASLSIYNFSGTPVWSLTNNAGGKYAINPSTGAVTVIGALSAVNDQIIIAVSGITLGNSGGGSVAPLLSNIIVSDVRGRRHHAN